MLEGLSGAVTSRAITQATREEVGRSALRGLLAVCIALAMAACWQLIGASRPDSRLIWLATSATLALWATLGLSNWNLSAGKATFVSLSWAIAAAALALTHSPQAAYLFLVPVAAAGALFRPYLAPACGFSGAVATLVVLGGGGGSPAAVTAVGGVCLWLILRPLHAVLQQYARQGMQATLLSERLRDQRGQLNRTIKDLDASYQLLRKTNRDLAVACQEADALRGLRHRFATNLSHELRTPLNVILGFSRLVYSRPELYGYGQWREELRRDLAEIQRNAGYLAGLVDDIVDLARADALAMPVRREVTSLGQVIEEAIQTAGSQARSKGLDLSVSIPPELPPLPLDPVRIRQVLYNLLTNAIRYTDRGNVSVQARRDGEEVIVSVTDTGCGIPPEELKTIFNEFHQVGREREREKGGKGLGLAIAKRFIQLHGGRTWAESELGRGSTFAFALPVGEKSVGLLKEGGHSPGPGQRAGRAPVLVLGDDGTAAAYLRRRVEGYDFVPLERPDQVAEVEGSLAAVAAILNLPLEREAQQALRERVTANPLNLPVIECSLPSASWLVSGHRFSGVLSKPISYEKLLSTLSAIAHGPPPRSILIADDDRSLVQLVVRLLEAAGDSYRVTAAYGGEEALRRIRRGRPDAVLLDLLMPDMSGFDVAARMGEDPDLEQIPVIAMTAATPGEDQLATLGATFALSKRSSFRPGELAGLIASTLDVLTGALGAGQDSG